MNILWASFMGDRRLFFRKDYLKPAQDVVVPYVPM